MKKVAGTSPPATTADAELLPVLTITFGQVVLVKIGGSHLESEAGVEKVAADIRTLRDAGALVAVVHGGGKGIDAAMTEAGLEITKVAGLRVTSPQALDVIEFVLRRTNRRLVRALRKLGVGAVGVDAADTVHAMKHPPVQAASGPASLGQVGEVVGFDFDGCEALRKDMVDGVVPVIYCIGEVGGVHRPDRARVEVAAKDVAQEQTGPLRCAALQEAGVGDRFEAFEDITQCHDHARLPDGRGPGQRVSRESPRLLRTCLPGEAG